MCIFVHYENRITLIRHFINSACVIHINICIRAIVKKQKARYYRLRRRLPGPI